MKMVAEFITAKNLLKQMDGNKIHALIACNLLIDCLTNSDSKTKNNKEFWIDVKNYLNII